MKLAKVARVCFFYPEEMVLDKGGEEGSCGVMKGRERKMAFYIGKTDDADTNKNKTRSKTQTSEARLNHTCF